MKLFRGFKLKNHKGMSHWACILEEWIFSIERYARVMKGMDAPYYYNERANISVLSGAAWRCGWIALEEFQSEKSSPSDNRSLGRADLYLASDDHEQVIEAKFKWVHMKSEKLGEQVKETLDQAVKDAKSTQNRDEEIAAIGIGFFPVYVKAKDMTEGDDLIQATLDSFENQDFHAMAWCFPPEMRSDSSNKKNTRPGIIMLVKNVKYSG